jgi:enoyl-CoA hydratase/carnithine racemase
MSNDIVVKRSGHVATVTLTRPPNNFYDVAVMTSLVEALESASAESECGVLVLASEGRHFCAGADFGGTTGNPFPIPEGLELYDVALRLFRIDIPMVAAVHGGAIGGGLGLALSADFRVASTESFFAGPFAAIGLHHGFGLSATLPSVIGRQRSLDLLLTARRVYGEEAFGWGLCDRLCHTGDEVLASAYELAESLAGGAPLAARSIRRTLLTDRFDQVVQAVALEKREQERLVETEDWREANLARSQNRSPHFRGR